MRDDPGEHAGMDDNPYDSPQCDEPSDEVSPWKVWLQRHWLTVWIGGVVLPSLLLYLPIPFIRFSNQCLHFPWVTIPFWPYFVGLNALGFALILLGAIASRKRFAVTLLLLPFGGLAMACCVVVVNYLVLVILG